MPIQRTYLSGATPARTSPADLREASGPGMTPGQVRWAAARLYGGSAEGVGLTSGHGNDSRHVQKWRTCGAVSAPVTVRDGEGKITEVRPAVENPAEWSECHTIIRGADRGARPSGGQAEGALSERDRKRARTLKLPHSNGGTYEERFLLPELPTAATPKPEMRKGRKRGKRGGRRGRGKR